jgi:hypothetical protein
MELPLTDSDFREDLLARRSRTTAMANGIWLHASSIKDHSPSTRAAKLIAFRKYGSILDRAEVRATGSGESLFKRGRQRCAATARPDLRIGSGSQA